MIMCFALDRILMALIDNLCKHLSQNVIIPTFGVVAAVVWEGGPDA